MTSASTARTDGDDYAAEEILALQEATAASAAPSAPSRASSRG